MIVVGQQVKVRGEDYHIVGIRNLSHLGSKFFGKFRFTVEDKDGRKYTCTGKTITGNTKLNAEGE